MILSRALLIAAALLAADLAVCTYLLATSGHSLPAPPSPEYPADTAIVFYGGDGPASDSRVAAAVTAYAAGTVRTLTFVGGCRPAKGKYGARDMADTAIQAGVAPADIRLGAGSYDSRTNLIRAHAVMAENTWTSATYVSDGLHLKRLLTDPPPGMTISALRSDYPQSVLAKPQRANYELLYGGLDMILTDAALDRMIRKRRLGPQAAGTVIPDCSAGLARQND